MKLYWKSTLKNVSFMILMLQLCVVFGQKKVVVIDVGHGGKDSGGIGVNGILEKDVVLDIAAEIIELNKTILDDSFDIYLTRYKDTLISISDRTKLARILNADLFISLHCNHSDSPKARGVEAYVWNPIYNKLTPEMSASILMAYSITKDLERLGLKSRGVKFANFRVLRETIHCHPSVLLELGFLSNWDDAEFTRVAYGKRAYALSILKSIPKYLEK